MKAPAAAEAERWTGDGMDNDDDDDSDGGGGGYGGDFGPDDDFDEPRDDVRAQGKRVDVQLVGGGGGKGTCHGGHLAHQTCGDVDVIRSVSSVLL